MYKFCTALHFPSQSTASAKFFKFCQCRLPSNFAGTRWMHSTSSLFDNVCFKNYVFCFFVDNLVFTFPHLHSTWLSYLWFSMFFFYQNAPEVSESLKDRVTEFSSWGLFHWSFFPWLSYKPHFRIFSLENGTQLNAHHDVNDTVPLIFFSLNPSFPMHKQILQLGHTGLNLKLLSVIYIARSGTAPPPPPPCSNYLYHKDPAG